MESKTLQFIIEHEGEDHNKILLSASRYPDVDIPTAARSIAARKKIKSKIPTFYNEPSLIYPTTLSLEQCSSEATAIYKQSLIPQGCKVADLTGGLGVDSFFFSKKAKSVEYYERNGELASAVKENFASLGAYNINVNPFNINVSYIDSDQFNNFDIIFLDPARRDRSGGRVFSVSDCEPNLIELEKHLLNKGESVIAKISPMADLSHLINTFRTLREIHIVSVDNECKELLLILKKGERVGDIVLHCVNISKGSRQHFSFTPEEESAISPLLFQEEILEDGEDLFLYEPNRSILKAGAFKLISHNFSLWKLSHSTHLYLSNKLIEDFPGKCFRVTEHRQFSKKVVSEWKKSHPYASVTTKNFPISSEDLAKKLGCKESDKFHIFACQVSDGEKKIFFTEKVF